MLLVLTVASAAAQDVTSKQERKQELEKEIKFIDGQLKNLSSKAKATTEHLTLIRRKVTDRRSVISDIEAQIRETEQRIRVKNAEIESLTREMDTLTVYFERLVYNTYKNRNPKVWFMYVLGSEDIGQGYRRLRYLKNLSTVVNEQGEKIVSLREQLEKEKAQLAEERQKALEMKKLRQGEVKKLEGEEAESRKLMNDITRSRKKYQGDLEAKRREVNRLNKEIESLLSKTVKAQKKQKQSVDVALSSKFDQNRGKLPWPVAQGIIVERFGIHTHPVYKNIKLPENNGVTISTTSGAQALCVFDGVVKQVVVIPGYNQCVLVQHGEFFTFYCKLAKVTVKAGDSLKTGQALGTLETDGGATTIHFQIWKGTVKQNPENWLRPRP